jgi:hypothetical protein
VSQGGSDHLSHRLVARGLRRGTAVAVLLGCEIVLGLLAVLAGRRVLPVALAVLVAVAVLAALLAATAPADVYEEAVQGLPTRLKRAVAVLVLAVPVLGAPAAFALVGARAPAEAGADAAEQAVEALRAGDSQASTALFGQARRQLDTAGERLRGPLVSLGLVVPGLSSNLYAARTLVSVNSRLVAAGAEVARAAGADPVAAGPGTGTLARLERLRPALERAVEVVERSRPRVAKVEGSFLLPPISDAVHRLQGHLASDVDATAVGAESARLLPTVLGGHGPRHYFLAFQNPAALRGAGGLIGNWGELVAEGATVRLERFGPLDELVDAGQSWAQIDVSPDFPTTARLIGEAYPRSGGRPLDGVLAVDPPGMAAILRLAGPIEVPGWSMPITSDNVVDVVLRQAYEAFADPAEQVAFLGQVDRGVAEAFTHVDLGRMVPVAAALGQAAGDGHLLLWMTQPVEQRLMADLGVDGGVDAVRGDSVLVVNQNLASNQVDAFLRRRVRYDVTLDPSSTPAVVRGRMEITFANGAPPSGLSSAVLGPHDENFLPGENRTYVSVYSPLTGGGAAVDGRAVELDSRSDLGRTARSTTMSVPAQASSTLTLDVEGRVALSEGGWYRLDLLHQTSLAPDEVEVAVSVPKGWRIVDVRGLDRRDARRAEARLELERSHTILLQLERTGWAGVWERLTDRS